MPKIGLVAGLRFDVNQEAQLFAVKPRLCHDVQLVPFTASHIRKDLLVEKLNRLPIKTVGQLRKEQLDEFHKERGQ
jgi:hypothetical protein